MLMHKIGVIFCSYAIPESTAESIKPWLKLGCKIAGVSFPFKDFPPQDNIENLEILKDLHSEFPNFISLEYGNEPLPESDIRNLALEKLKPFCSHFIIVDADEYYQEKDILMLDKYLYDNTLHAFYKIEFKNLFGENQWYPGFNPARIFRFSWNNLFINKFHYDNDILYLNEMDGTLIDCKSLPHKTIPKHILNPIHDSWGNNLRSKNKIEYQIKHFGNGNINACSFKWDEKSNEIKLNLDYYKITGKEIPILFNL